MIDIKLDKTTHDWVLDDNFDLVLVDNEEQLMQEIKQRLLVIKGEYFRDTNAGFPWYETVFKKGTPESTITNLIKASIMDDPEGRILEILDFTYARTERNQTSITCKLRTIYSTTTFEVQL